MKLMKDCVNCRVVHIDLCIIFCISICNHGLYIMHCTVNCSLVDPYTFRLYALIASVVECAVLCREVCNIFSSVQKQQCSVTM